MDISCPNIPDFETNEGFDCGEGIHLSGVDHSTVAGRFAGFFPSRARTRARDGKNYSNHRQVDEWFDEYDELAADDGQKAELAEKICLALKVHAQIEEEIFYPQARDATKDNDLIDEAIVEHATVKNLIGEIEAMEVGDDLYDAKIRVLGEMVKRHIKEEEEELFPELQSAKMDIDAVGKELAERKEELMSELA